VSCPNDEKQRCVKNNQTETKLKTLGNKATGHSESPDTALKEHSHEDFADFWSTLC